MEGKYKNYELEYRIYIFPRKEKIETSEYDRIIIFALHIPAGNIHRSWIDTKQRIA